MFHFSFSPTHYSLTLHTRTVPRFTFPFYNFVSGISSNSCYHYSFHLGSRLSLFEGGTVHFSPPFYSPLHSPLHALTSVRNPFHHLVHIPGSFPLYFLHFLFFIFLIKLLTWHYFTLQLLSPNFISHFNPQLLMFPTSYIPNSASASSAPCNPCPDIFHCILRVFSDDMFVTQTDCNI